MRKLFGKAKKRESSDKIAGVDIIWAANKEGAKTLASLGAEMGLDLREVVSATMGRGGSRDDLLVSANRTRLSPVRKAWCETTPIYKDRVGGGIVVLFEKVDDETCKERGLEYVGTISPEDYTAALCATHGINAAGVVV
jgi:hypothetical protein